MFSVRGTVGASRKAHREWRKERESGGEEIGTCTRMEYVVRVILCTASRRDPNSQMQIVKPDS